MTKYFQVDARAVIHLGRENVRDSITAVLELVKNAYDAGAEVVALHVATSDPNPDHHFIRIIDNGSGMSESQIEQNWLRIGWSEKRKTPIVAGRALTGEKGIGRLSADRLGAVLRLTSTAEGQPCTGLQINWDAFANDCKLESVPISEMTNPEVGFSLLPVRNNEREHYRKIAGTQLIISALRQSWTSEQIAGLREDLRRLTSPFSAFGRQHCNDDSDVELPTTLKDFDIYVSSDVDSENNGFVEPLPIASRAPLDLYVSVSDTGDIHYEMSRYDPERQGTVLEKASIPWRQFRLMDGHRQLSLLDTHYVAGPMTMRMLFLPRKADVARDIELSLRDLKDILDRSGGIRIYRDGIWLKPYGKPNDPAFDWLGLGIRKTREPAGASRDRFRVSPNQLIGAVSITRALNPRLVDSVGREGLIQNEAFAQLTTIALGCLSQLESAWIRATKEGKPETVPTRSPREAVDALAEGLREVRAAFGPLSAVLDDSQQESILEARAAVDRLVPVVDAAGQAVDEYADQALVLRALSSIGIASSVFAHETQNHLAQAGLSVGNALSLMGLSPISVGEIEQELGKAGGAIERLTEWGAFTLGRIARDARVRQKVDFAEVVGRLLDELEPSFKQVHATIERNLNSVSSRIFPSDLESLVLNLVTNSYTACKQGRDRRVRISIEADMSGKDAWGTLTIADSGPGIPTSNIDKIWEPLFTTKVDESGRPIGTGLGLAIVRSIVSDMKSTITVDDDPVLPGARFTIRIPIRKEKSL